MNWKKFAPILAVFALVFIGLASAVDFSPQGNITLKNRYYILNDSAGSCPTGTIVQGKNVSGFWNCSTGATIINISWQNIDESTEPTICPNNSAVVGIGHSNTCIDVRSMVNGSDFYMTSLVIGTQLCIGSICRSAWPYNTTEEILLVTNNSAEWRATKFCMGTDCVVAWSRGNTSAEMISATASSYQPIGVANTTTEIRTAINGSDYYMTSLVVGTQTTTETADGEATTFNDGSVFAGTYANTQSDNGDMEYIDENATNRLRWNYDFNTSHNGKNIRSMVVFTNDTGFTFEKVGFSILNCDTGAWDILYTGSTVGYKNVAVTVDSATLLSRYVNQTTGQIKMTFYDLGTYGGMQTFSLDYLAVVVTTISSSPGNGNITAYSLIANDSICIGSICRSTWPLGQGNTTAEMQAAIAGSDTWLHSLGIGKSGVLGLLDVDGGLSNNTYGDLVQFDSQISSPYMSIGYAENWLLQSESFDTSWTRINGSVVVANLDFCPIGTVIAEILRGNVTSTGIYQNVTDLTKGNYTFSVYLRNYNVSADVIAQLGMSSNNETTVWSNVTLTNKWERYAMTFNFTNDHVNKTVYIRNGIYNVSAWGAQLTRGSTAQVYHAARTTTNTTVPTLLAYFRTPLTTTGAIASGGAISATGNAITSATITTTGLITGVGVAVGGALTTASTGAFSGIVTHTSAPAFVSSDGVVITSTTAATLAAPIQLTPRIRLSGTVWDEGAAASRTINWKIEGIPISSGNSTSKLVIGYGYNDVTDVGIAHIVSIGSNGTLDVFGNSFGSNILANGDFAGNASWNTTGGWRFMGDALNTSRYQFSLGATGDLTQPPTSFLAAANPNRWYKLSYNISGTGVAGCVAYVNKNFSTTNVYLPGPSVVTAGQRFDVNVKSNSAPGNFTISARCTAGSFYLDNLTLVEFTSGDIIANGRFTGGNTKGIKIDGSGNVTIDSLVKLTANTTNINCNAGNAGTIIWDGTNFLGCKTTLWAAL